MKNRHIPALSEDNWVNTPMLKADYIFSHFFLSNYSQSYLYRGHVHSLAKIIQANNNNVESTVEELRSSLVNYFSKYFTNVVAEVTEVPNETDPSSAIITMYVKFSDNGAEYVLGKLLEVLNSKIKKIKDINNGTEVTL